MARTEIPVTDIALTGTTPPAQTSGAAEMEFGPNDGQVFLEVKNASTTTTQKFTLVIPGDVDGLAITDKEFEVAKEATQLFGPFTPADFNNKHSQVFINSASAELKFRAFRV